VCVCARARARGKRGERIKGREDTRAERASEREGRREGRREGGTERARGGEIEREGGREGDDAAWLFYEGTGLFCTRARDTCLTFAHGLTQRPSSPAAGPGGRRVAPDMEGRARLPLGRRRSGDEESVRNACRAPGAAAVLRRWLRRRELLRGWLPRGAPRTMAASY